MSTAAYTDTASPSWSRTANGYRQGALVSGATVALMVHVAAIGAIFSMAATQIVSPSLPIMVSMITAPVPDPIQPEPEVLPKPLPATRQPLPAPKTLLVAEKPAAEPVQAAPTLPAPPAAVPAQPEPAPAPVLEPPRNAAYLNNPTNYPLIAKRLGEQGTVLLNVLVNADGSVVQVELKKSSGSPRLDQNAIDTVKRWTFIPAKRGAQAVSGWVGIPVKYSLTEG